MDLFVHELSDMYSAETIIGDMLELAAAEAANDQLQQSMLQHRIQTREHAQKIARIFEMLDQQPQAVRCYAADGLMMSLQEGLQAAETEYTMDGLIAAGGRKTESLEIASYTGLIKKAQLMDRQDVVALLQQNLQQEQAMLQQVEQFATELDRQVAHMMTGAITQPSDLGASAQG